MKTKQLPGDIFFHREVGSSQRGKQKHVMFLIKAKARCHSLPHFFCQRLPLAKPISSGQDNVLLLYWEELQSHMANDMDTQGVKNLE